MSGRDFWPVETPADRERRIESARDALGQLRDTTDRLFELIDAPPTSPARVTSDLLEEWLVKVEELGHAIGDVDVAFSEMVRWTRTLAPYTAHDDLTVAGARLGDALKHHGVAVGNLEKASRHYAAWREAQRELDV